MMSGKYNPSSRIYFEESSALCGPGVGNYLKLSDNSPVDLCSGKRLKAAQSRHPAQLPGRPTRRLCSGVKQPSNSTSDNNIFIPWNLRKKRALWHGCDFHSHWKD